MSRSYYEQDTDGIGSLIGDVIGAMKYDYETTITELQDELAGLRSERDDLVSQLDELQDEVNDLKVWHARRNDND